MWKVLRSEPLNVDSSLHFIPPVQAGSLSGVGNWLLTSISLVTEKPIGVDLTTWYDVIPSTSLPGPVSGSRCLSGKKDSKSSKELIYKEVPYGYPIKGLLNLTITTKNYYECSIQTKWSLVQMSRRVYWKGFHLVEINNRMIINILNIIIGGKSKTITIKQTRNKHEVVRSMS